MTNFRTISTRVNDDLYELIEAAAGSAGMTISKWLTDLIDSYMEMEEFTWDDLLDKDWDELVELVDNFELDVNPDDFKGGFLRRNNEDGLRGVIAVESGIVMEWDDLVEIAENLDLDLDLNPDNFDDTDELRDAISEELDAIPEPEEEEED